MYDVLTEKTYLNPSVRADLNRILFVIPDKQILVKQNKYTVEFVFMSTLFNRSLFVRLERIKKRMVNRVTFDHDLNGHLIIILERYKNIYYAK